MTLLLHLEQSFDHVASLTSLVDEIAKHHQDVLGLQTDHIQQCVQSKVTAMNIANGNGSMSAGIHVRRRCRRMRINGGLPIIVKARPSDHGRVYPLSDTSREYSRKMLRTGLPSATLAERFFRFGRSVRFHSIRAELTQRPVPNLGIGSLPAILSIGTRLADQRVSERPLGNRKTAPLTALKSEVFCGPAFPMGRGTSSTRFIVT